MTDPTAALEHRLRLAHAARRAKEHQLDDIRRALCDAGFMRDDDPYGHADLAGVIRQVGAVEAEKAAGNVCGHVGPDDDDPSNPCTLPLGHDMHRDGDGCSWPAPTGPALDRTAVRNVILFVASATGHPSPEFVDTLTDALWAKRSGQVESESAAAEVTPDDLQRVPDEQCATCLHPKQLHPDITYRNACMATYNVGADICDCMAYEAMGADHV